MDNKLLGQPRALSAPQAIFLTVSQQMLGVELHLTSLNAKSEPPKELVEEFSRAFADQPHEAIQWAFRRWRDESPFFPAVCDVRSLIGTWHRAKADEADAMRDAAERERVNAARAKGELVDFSDIVKRLTETAKGIPEPETSRRIRAVRESAAVAIVPAVELTPEQIEARRAAEKAEIERYAKES